MPRKSRIDAPGALHHVIIRGIERGKIFRSEIGNRLIRSSIDHFAYFTCGWSIFFANLFYQNFGNTVLPRMHCATVL